MVGLIRAEDAEERAGEQRQVRGSCLGGAGKGPRVYRAIWADVQKRLCVPGQATGPRSPPAPRWAAAWWKRTLYGERPSMILFGWTRYLPIGKAQLEHFRLCPDPGSMLCGEPLLYPHGLTGVDPDGPFSCCVVSRLMSPQKIYPCPNPGCL
jgi:hypothetical protein